MVHHQTDALGMSIIVKSFKVEVRIRSLKVKDIIFAMTKPVFPTNVPALYQYLRESIFSSKIYILLYILSIGRMLPMGFALAVIGNTETNRRKIISIRPLLATTYHLPPYPDVLYWLYPRCIGIFAGFIEIEYQARSQNLTGIIYHHDSTPRSRAWSLHMCHVALSIGGEL